MNIHESIKREILKGPIGILPYHQLRPALSVDIRHFDYQAATTMCELGKTIIGDRFVAVALTQIDHEIQNRVLRAHMGNAMIYINHGVEQTLDNTLLINPNISVPHHAHTIAHIEKCGSIPSLSMIVKRPSTVIVSASAFSPNNGFRTITDQEFSGQTAPILHHEDAHIRGKSAMDFPHELVDFTKIADNSWNGLDDFYRQYRMTMSEAVRYHIDNGVQRWLIYRNNTYQIISSRDAYQEMKTNHIL